MQEHPPDQLQTVLLLGPTGSGKSPLGDWLQRHGLCGRRCHHFDFGALLRAAVAGGPSSRFNPDEISFLNGILREGLLLEDDSFYLAAKILEGFIGDNHVSPLDWLVLNGLPRHPGQGRALAGRLHVRAVIQLHCPPEILRDRLRLNTGGDRSCRTDDADALVVGKLRLYEERTRPLVAYYSGMGARVIEVPVGLRTPPDDIVRLVSAHPLDVRH